ncbi:hypothetical protein BMETH_1505_0 [methanotrophic bacterial endosymbiont of Bathymodiolus sp.]|nr:hypothetical protein BMETH_1505_0 [methanotrophic bacterial endosymbiont of Bathymodiolus sp.]
MESFFIFCDIFGLCISCTSSQGLRGIHMGTLCVP